MRSRLTLLVTARIRDGATAVVFQFCGTFFVWILAEQLHLSGILTIVVYAMAASRRAPEILPARIRIPPLLLRLRLENDGAVDREVRLARVESLRAALAAAARPGAESAELVRHRYELQLRRAEEEFAGDGADTNGAAPEGAAATPASAANADGTADDAAVVRAAIEVQRRRLMALRADGTIGDSAFQRVEEELDWTELGWAQVVRSGQPAHGEP